MIQEEPKMMKLQIILLVVLFFYSRADPISDNAKEIESLDDALNDLIRGAEDESVKASEGESKLDATTDDQDIATDADTAPEMDSIDSADDVTDANPEEDSEPDPEEMPHLEAQDLELASDDVANDPFSSLAKTVIYCEHSRGRLHCPSGTRIFITAANYGRTTGRSVCPHSSIKTTNCRARVSLLKVRQACHNKASCVLYSSNSVFGDPCVGTYKYLQVSFRCRRVAPPFPAECRFGGRSGFRWMNDRDRAAGHTTQGGVKCDRNLQTAWYRFNGLAGRDLPTRPPPTHRCQTHAPGWFQGALPTRRYQLVSGKVCFHWSGNTCRWSTRIQVRNCGFYRVYKLSKTPQCSLRYCGNRQRSLPTPILTKRVCEGRSTTLSCPGKKKINVVYANYGRITGRNVCPHNSIKTTRCTSSYSNKLLRCACHGQSRCYLHSNNAVFGDPCVGTYKYIEVRYRCI